MTPINKIIDENSESGDSDKPVILIENKADSLYLSKSEYYYDQITSYALPVEANDIVIRKSDSHTLNFPPVISVKKGEKPNELVLFDDNERGRKKSLSVFYVGDTDNNPAIPDNPEELPGYNFLDYAQTYSIKSTEDDDPNIYPTASEADTVHIYTSYKEALKATSENQKFLIVYKEDSENQKDCMSIDQLRKKISYYDNANTFNEKFILYSVSKKDAGIFDKYKITEYPATVILSSDEKMIYSSSGKCINDLFADNLVSQPIGVYDLLSRQYLTTVLLPEIKSAKKPSKDLLLKYLTGLSSSEDSYAMSNVLYDLDESEKSTWNTDISLNESVGYFEMLITDYLKKEKPNTRNIELIMKNINFFNYNRLSDNDDSSYYYPIIKGNQLSPAFDYLLSAYEKYPEKNPEAKGDLFNFINMHAYQNIVYHDQNSDLIFSSMIKAAPSISNLEIPFASAVGINVSSDPTTKSKMSELTDSFLSGFVGADNLSRKIDTTFDKLYENQSPELFFVLQTCGYLEYSVTEEHEDAPESLSDKNTLKDAYRRMIAGCLNTNAWNTYLYTPGSDNTQLNKALAWSEASLLLQPDNAYYLDTKARLLFRLGRKQEAVSFQEKANERMKQINDSVTKREMNDALIHMKKE
jgi:hypothetical protein